MQPGKRQRELLNILQDDRGELWNDGGMWSGSCYKDDTRYSGRVPADPARRLFEQGYIYCVRIEAGGGVFGQDRAVYVLTEKGKWA
jgi:hypothetical protein